MSERKEDIVWRKLFEKYNILNEIATNGFFEIKADQIKRISSEIQGIESSEPRLMTKFDHENLLPKIFKDNNISILPNTRGTYLLGNFKTFEKIEYKNIKPKLISFPEEIESIDPKKITSEAAAILCAYNAGIIDELFGETMNFTVQGRMSTKEFDFTIKNNANNHNKIYVKNSQCEIDGGFESKNRFVLLEAKNGKVEDFIIRQLYYPFRLWEQKLKKEINPIFVTYSNEVYSFFIYTFSKTDNYNSIHLLEQKDYIINAEKITFKDLDKIFFRTKEEKEPSSPFPQADDFSKIYNIVHMLNNKKMSFDDITNYYGFDKRQTDYYTNGALYLDLIEKTKENRQVYFEISVIGKKIFRQNYKKKFLLIIEQMFKRKIFREMYRKYRENGEKMTEKEFILFMKQENFRKEMKSDSTLKRRYTSVIKWMDWIQELTERV